MSHRGIASWSRETRLLLLTIIVSVGALVVLARFRFPAQQAIQAPPPQPLERLAARATYDELASIVQRVERRVASSLLVLRTNTGIPDEPRNLDSVLAATELVGSSQPFVLALRVRPDVAIVHLTPGLRIEGVLGDADAVPLVIAEDRIRQMALVRVPPPGDGVDWRAQPVAALAVPRYVVAVEASRGGLMPRPVFLGRADRIDDPRWRTPLWILARTPVTAEGSFVFSLEGELIGLASSAGGLLAVVSTTALDAVTDRLLESGSPRVADFGLTLKPLTAEIIKATSRTTGVVIHAVARGSRVGDQLRVGDVIESVDGRPALTPDGVLLQLADVDRDATTRFLVHRGDATLTIDVSQGAATSQNRIPQ
jgi:hypothetical protein